MDDLKVKEILLTSRNSGRFGRKAEGLKDFLCKLEVRVYP